jgi:cbb3-type cytochrome oxidase subunit 3
MYRAFYESLTFAWLPAATTIFFVAFFGLVLVFALGRSRRFDDVAALPLKEDKS